MPIEKILILEDELIARKNLEHQLKNRGFEVAVAGTLAEAHELLSRDAYDLIFLDLMLPDGRGTDLLQELQTRPQRPIVVITTGFGSIQSAVECMRNGAFDYLTKPFESEHLDLVLRRADEFSQLVRVNRYYAQEEAEDTGYELIGRSPAMEALRQMIRKVAPTQATVLIQGESGTGKELVARALYRQSPRAHAPFIKVNCAAIPENLIESEFFGHEKGAYTGALTKRDGRFELAHGGTILLDEVSEISPQVQAKLLRVLQERELERVGGNRTIKVDVRVIATTNRQLEQSVARKEFRQDLFFRLNVVPIHVPPLRERRSDIPELAEQFMYRSARKNGVRVTGISEACMRALMAHEWPGNVRELQNVIERAVILSSGSGVLEADHLGFMPSIELISPRQEEPPAAGAQPAPPAGGPPPPAPSAGSGHPADTVIPLAEVEKQQILKALEHTHGNRTHAARLLGISIRTLRNKLHEYGYGRGSREEEADDGAEGGAS